MQSLSLKRILLAGGTAVVLGGSTLGLALAEQTPTPGAQPPAQSSQARPSYQALLDAVARRLGITTERLEQALAEARTEFGLPERGMKPGFGFGMRHHGFGRGGVDLSVAAQAIGISVEQLRQELPGQSLAQVAQAHGMSPADVAAALQDAANRRIDEAVAAGRLAAEQAATAKQQAAEHIDQHMNQTVSSGSKGFRGRSPGMPATPTPAA